MTNHSRREFLRSASFGAAGVGLSSYAAASPSGSHQYAKLPREVWIATISQSNIRGNDLESTLKSAIRQMENAVPFRPDIYCLPEVFHWQGIQGKKPSATSTAENGSGNIIHPFQEFAKKNNCYIVCPVYTVENGKYYNAAVLIDRQGKYAGEYRKIRLTVGEMKNLTPGPRDVPVFKTDFGVIGIQICFDIEWPAGWRQLGEKGAEIVFWPSAFPGGKMVNTYAWQNHYCVVSSTWRTRSKICDITGDEIAASGNYSEWGVCAPVNLEKTFLHTWPYNRHFSDIEKKYGRKIRLYTLHEEEFTIIESLSDDIKVADIMKEFDLKTHKEHMKIAEKEQDKFYS